MTKLKLAPAELMPESETIPEMPAELMPTDGQPETAPEAMPEMVADNPAAADLGFRGSPTATMTTTINGLYSPDEFRQKFSGLLEFLENPATAQDATAALLTNGRTLTADKIYNLASRYKWLNWIISPDTQFFADSLQIAAFLAVESNLIVLNWTGVNLWGKLKIWLQTKAKERQSAEKSRRSLFGWVFSGRQAQEKAQGQEN